MQMMLSVSFRIFPRNSLQSWSAPRLERWLGRTRPSTPSCRLRRDMHGSSSFTCKALQQVANASCSRATLLRHPTSGAPRSRTGNYSACIRNLPRPRTDCYNGCIHCRAFRRPRRSNDAALHGPARGDEIRANSLFWFEFELRQCPGSVVDLDTIVKEKEYVPTAGTDSGDEPGVAPIATIARAVERMSYGWWTCWVHG